MSSAPVRIVVMEGDGIGPEITAATLEVLRTAERVFALGLSFAPVTVGFAALRAHGSTLPEAAAVHIRRVLRLRAGAELTVFDGRGGEFAATLLAGGGPLRAQIGEHHPVERETPLPVTLLQGLARGERMDWIVQKATELGAAAIAPVTGRYSVVQLE